MEQKLGSSGTNVNFLCLGDFNARTGTDIEYINDEDNTNLTIPMDIYETDIIATYPRGNMDEVKNVTGSNLSNCAKASR